MHEGVHGQADGDSAYRHACRRPQQFSPCDWIAFSVAITEGSIRPGCEVSCSLQMGNEFRGGRRFEWEGGPLVITREVGNMEPAYTPFV